MPVDFDKISSTIGQAANKMEKDIGEAQSQIDPNEMTTAEMIQMQAMMQKWTMTTQLQSTMVKTLGDAIKGIIQKM